METVSPSRPNRRLEELDMRDTGKQLPWQWGSEYAQSITHSFWFTGMQGVFWSGKCTWFICWMHCQQSQPWSISGDGWETFSTLRHHRNIPSCQSQSLSGMWLTAWKATLHCTVCIRWNKKRSLISTLDHSPKKKGTHCMKSSIKLCICASLTKCTVMPRYE